MTMIHLARHGQTVWHAENRNAGSSDVDLSAEGVRQAAVLAEWAAASGVETVVSSPLRCAVDTAQAVVRRTGARHHVDARLVEVGFGRGEGLTRSEMAVGFPEDLERFLANPASWPLPGGEAGEQAVARALPALTEWASGEERPILIVAHTTLIRLVLCEVLGIELDAYRRAFPSLDNVSITSLELVTTGTSAGGTTGQLLRYNAPILSTLFRQNPHA